MPLLLNKIVHTWQDTRWLCLHSWFCERCNKGYKLIVTLKKNNQNLVLKITIAPQYQYVSLRHHSAANMCLVIRIQKKTMDTQSDFLISLKVVWFGGSRTSILTSYLESAGLFTPGVKFSSYSVKPLPRYYNIQTGSKLVTENHDLGNPSHLMT
mgnify:CR=1 FL=1